MPCKCESIDDVIASLYVASRDRANYARLQGDYDSQKHYNARMGAYREVLAGVGGVSPTSLAAEYRLQNAIERVLRDE